MLDRKDASKIFAEFKQVTNEDINRQIDYKKCSLGLIEKMVDVTKDVTKEKVRDYNKLSTKQKVGLAFSAIIPPVAIVTYFLMKKSNRSKKEALENKLTVSINKISADLEKVAPTTKKASAVDLANEIGKQLENIKPKERSNSSQAINNNMSRSGSSRVR